ncbi:uncharacterized protein LOC127122428 [Lathyrus oleraceus]|uniref:uncharacterized protein LOC127122428 n=1 Tax=Pisum sativum TaxID=3888 RepID=UPI0021CDEC71|nr:uncharacterized protein LOC127122428 [Pisum sativum]
MRIFLNFQGKLEILFENIANILITDIGRRNTRKYSFRYPDLMKLRKLASFVDDPKDFRDRFGRILYVLSTDVEDGLLCTLAHFYDPVYRCFTFPNYQLFPTMEEYAYILGMPVSDRVPFSGMEVIIESRVIPEAIHLRKFDIDANITIKGGIRGLNLKFLSEKAFYLANACSMVAFETILTLLIYGLVLFPNIDNFVDVSALRIFLIRNPVPTLHGDTYFSIHHRTYKGSGTIVCCTPLLYKWFISYMSQSHIFKENKGCLRWSHRVMSLTNDDIAWYSSTYDDVKIIGNCGEFYNVPLLGTQGGINYNSDLEGKYTQGLKARMVRFWHNVRRKGKSDIGLNNCIALKPYTSWVKKRAEEFKMPYTYERHMSLVMGSSYFLGFHPDKLIYRYNTRANQLKKMDRLEQENCELCEEVTILRDNYERLTAMTETLVAAQNQPPPPPF